MCVNYSLTKVGKNVSILLFQPDKKFPFVLHAAYVLYVNFKTHYRVVWLFLFLLIFILFLEQS